ncbi:MAG: IscA/HesB family protein [Proteobacteria bacterium]|nr:IscA/HesB family protein [Pseudomonadota bacterium]MBU1717283.1 IscA/HesB family protein [Pseudomonadota bacterium]
MITVSPLAAEKLADYLLENNIESAVRITVMNGCGGMSLGLALDDRQENDHVLEHGKFTLLVAKDLAGECGQITLDFVEKKSGCGCGGGGGFSITSEKPLPDAAGGCGGSCGSGSCGC